MIERTEKNQTVIGVSGDAGAGLGEKTSKSLRD